MGRGEPAPLVSRTLWNREDLPSRGSGPRGELGWDLKGLGEQRLLASGWKALPAALVRHTRQEGASGENARRAFTCRPGEDHTLAGLDFQAEQV